MNTLGIYFGPQIISVIETKGREPVKNIQIPHSLISPQAPGEEKVPEEVKLVALLKDELTKNAIEAREVVVSLSGKDLIIRTFEMPIIPRQEIHDAVNFEVKKYIPFKTEDLVSDFQWQFDRTIQKTRVLYVGTKKETLEKYLSVLKQLGLKIISIEYSAFSVLRLLKLAGIHEKGIVALVNIDATKDDEANFVVLENGFPLFSRDITFPGGYEEAAREGEDQGSITSGKLRREIQISLDYYERKFPGKSIGKIFFLTSPGYRADLEGFFKESSLPIQFIDISRVTGRAVPFSLAFVKGYSSSLYRIDTGLKINLLLAKEKAIKKASLEKKGWTSLFALLRVSAKLIIAGFFVCLAVFLFGTYRLLPVRKEVESIINMRPPVSTVSADLSYDELVTKNSNYKLKIEAMDNLIKKRSYLTPLLDALPRIIPKGTWLVNLSFKEEKEKTELLLEGTAYLGNADKELGLINTLISDLRANSTFKQYFKEISLVSARLDNSRKVSVTNFTVSCLGDKKGQATE